MATRSTTFYCLALLLFARLNAPATCAEITDPIKVEGGKISGAVVGTTPAIRVYKGIPFAAPPVGDLRWKAPEKIVPWEGVRACTEFSAGCVQPRSPIPLPGLNAPTASEDCLYLNVWTPAKSEKDKLPVMVWIHGGGFTMGTAGVPMYDGEALARKGVILVTINYRLGPFGFMAHPALTKESKHHSSGNYGLLDQIAGLEWVKKNIGQFGGDSKNVTIFGESAGGVSVSLLMVSPLAKGLFHRAIAESGAATLLPLRHLKESNAGRETCEDQGITIAKALGCDTAADPLAAMRAKSSEEVLNAGPKTSLTAGSIFASSAFPFWAIVDGWVIPDDPDKLFKSGKQADVPFMVGTNADEGSMFTMMLPIRDTAGYETLMRTNFANRADEVMKIYPAADASQIKPALNDMLTNALFICPSRIMIGSMSNVKSKPYFYHFTKTHATGFGSNLGAHHAAEIPYVFGGLEAQKIVTEADAELSRKMMSYWTNFARTGDPNGDGLPVWPAYDTKEEPYIELGEKVEAKNHLRKDRLDQLDQIIAERMSQPAAPVGN